MLWTLYHRAIEARRADAVLDDPKAVELVELDRPTRSRALRQRRWRPRAVAGTARRRSASSVERFLADDIQTAPWSRSARAETQFWRVDNGRVRG